MQVYKTPDFVYQSREKEERGILAIAERRA